MPVAIRATLVGGDKLRARLKKLNPEQNTRVMSEALKNAAQLGQANAAKEQIISGGKQAAVRGRLTSRSGTGRRSIRTNFGGPHFAEWGTDSGYMGAHETGGTFSKKASSVRAHTRRSAFGRKTAPFTVPQHRRGAHSVTIPRRPFLEPSLDVVVARGPALLLKALERHT